MPPRGRAQGRGPYAAPKGTEGSVNASARGDHHHRRRKPVLYALEAGRKRNTYKEDLMRKIFRAVTANRKRKPLDRGGHHPARRRRERRGLLRDSQRHAGTGRGNQQLGSTPCTGCTQNQQVNITLIARCPDGMNPSSASSPSGAPFTMTANNPGAYDGHVKTITLTTIKSSNAGCETVLSNPTRGVLRSGGRTARSPGAEAPS